MSFTLTQTIEKVRERADMQNSQFVSDAEVTGYINASHGELYDILVSRFEDYFITETLFTIASGVHNYALPSTVYKVRGVDYALTADKFYNLRRFNFEDRNRIGGNSRRLSSARQDRQYRVMGGNLMILPEDKAAGDYKLWSIPRATALVTGSDVMGDVLDFEEYVVVDAAIKCLLKEESDPSSLYIIKKDLKARIEAMSANRDTTPERITDVRSGNDDDDFVGW